VRGGSPASTLSVAEVNAVLDHHPIETSDQYLRRALALLDLDELEVAFRQKALDGDVSAGVRLSRRHAARPQCPDRYLTNLPTPGYALALLIIVLVIWRLLRRLWATSSPGQPLPMRCSNAPVARAH
jgi:hypothetical protein